MNYKSVHRSPLSCIIRPHFQCADIKHVSTKGNYLQEPIINNFLYSCLKLTSGLHIYICTLQYTFQHCTMCSSFLYSNTKSVFFIMSCTFFPNRKKQWSLHKFVKQMCWPSLSAALHWQAEKTWIKRFYGSTAIHPNTNIPLPPTKKTQTGAGYTALSTWKRGHSWLLKVVTS